MARRARRPRRRRRRATSRQHARPAPQTPRGPRPNTIFTRGLWPTGRGGSGRRSSPTPARAGSAIRLARRPHRPATGRLGGLNGPARGRADLVRHGKDGRRSPRLADVSPAGEDLSTFRGCCGLGYRCRDGPLVGGSPPPPTGASTSCTRAGAPSLRLKKTRRGEKPKYPCDVRPCRRARVRSWGGRELGDRRSRASQWTGRVTTSDGPGSTRRACGCSPRRGPDPAPLPLEARSRGKPPPDPCDHAGAT